MKVRTRKIKEFNVSYVNWWELWWIYLEVFVIKEYFFKSEKDEPLIIDAGAHVGLATLFFKRLYPDARVIAFEANSDTFKLLKMNIEQNRLKEVELVNAAVANKNGKIGLYVADKGSWKDSTKKGTKNGHRIMRVPAVCLSDYIKEDIALLKLDIEGAETEVLEEVADKLDKVKQIILEFHYDLVDPRNRLEFIIELLSKHNYLVTVSMTFIPLSKFWLMQYLKLLSFLKVKRYVLQIFAYRV